jgi:parallel beta-helix repeat protein
MYPPQFFVNYDINLNNENCRYLSSKINVENPRYKTTFNKLDIIYVPDDFLTIQAAVDNANPDDTIMVRPGVYPEHINVDKSLEIIGEGYEDVLVDGNNESEYIFTISAEDVKISGFTIQNCSLDSAGFLINNNYANIDGNRIRNCGSGVEILGQFQSINDVTIYNNEIIDNNWGIYTNNIADVLIEGNDINNNNFGIELCFSQVEIIDNFIENNFEKGILLMRSDQVILEYNNITHNSIYENKDFAGIWITWSNDCIFKNNIIDNNYMDGITLLRSSNNNFTKNKFNSNELVSINFRMDNHHNELINNEIVTEFECGLFFNTSTNNIIFENDIINNNNKNCVVLTNSNDNEFIENNFSHNAYCNNNEYGFIVYSASCGNICYHNNFLNGCNAIDECSNIWDDSNYYGNHWENYVVNDDNGDGIGDVHYDIVGGNRDNFPLMFPWAPPSKPNKPSGEINGKIGVEYSYSTSSIDPDGCKICYGWDWNGDKNVNEWTDLCNSGEIISTKHVWDKDGTYQISVIAKNKHGQMSGWSDSLDVSMPRNKFLFKQNSIFLSHFKILYLILKRCVYNYNTILLLENYK